MNETLQNLRDFSDVITPHLNERSRRIVLAAQARMLGRGGVSRVSQAAGVSRPTIYAGLSELSGAALPSDPTRIRRVGGGRKSATAPVSYTHLTLPTKRIV